MALDKDKILTHKDFKENLEQILDDFEAGDHTPIKIGRWGREVEAIAIPYDMYEKIVKVKEALDDVKGNEEEAV